MPICYSLAQELKPIIDVTLKEFLKDHLKLEVIKNRDYTIFHIGIDNEQICSQIIPND